jgi:hypothetical protein
LENAGVERDVILSCWFGCIACDWVGLSGGYLRFFGDVVGCWCGIFVEDEGVYVWLGWCFWALIEDLVV